MKSSEELKHRVKELVQPRIAINQKNWDVYVRLFPAMNRMIKGFTLPLVGPLLKKAFALYDVEKEFSQGYIVPLNRNIDYRKGARNTVLPHTLVQKLIKGSSYRVVLDKCLCREGAKCSQYPVDFGCIFLGEGTRKLVDNGIAREVTKKVALAHLKRAGDLGLVAMCLWMEMEAFGLGLNEEEHTRFLEVCLCCPCCCLGLQNFRSMGSDVMQRFRSIGWRAASREGCVGCGTCATVCPVGAIAVHADSISVAESCLGCGLCAERCPEDAIFMNQVQPIKKDIRDYFFGIQPEI